MTPTDEQLDAVAAALIPRMERIASMNPNPAYTKAQKARKNKAMLTRRLAELQAEAETIWCELKGME